MAELVEAQLHPSTSSGIVATGETELIAEHVEAQLHPMAEPLETPFQPTKRPADASASGRKT